MFIKKALDCKGNIISHDITAIKGRESRFNVVDGMAFEKPATMEVSKQKEVEAPAQEGSLEEWQAKYLERFEKEVPPRYKNDVEWIMKKVTE